MMRSTIASDLRALLALAFASALAWPSAARADADKPLGSSAMAEALFKEGKKLLKEGKVAEACRKLEGSYRIDAAPGTLINLAICHEQEGKTATAWGEFNASRELAKKARRFDREKIAKEHISALEPKLSRFVVAVPPEAVVEGLVVEMDGVPLEDGAWGTAIPIDPGVHDAVAKAPKYKTWSTKFKVEEAKVATLLVPPLEKLPPPTPPAPPPGSWKRPAGYAAIGVSAALLGIGGYFGVRALSLGGETAAQCKNKVCNAAGWEALGDGRSAATAANVLFPVGLAVAGAGAFLLITAPRAAEPMPEEEPGVAQSRSFHVTAAPLPGGGFVGIGGAF
jgi:hypothetical protein